MLIINPRIHVQVFPTFVSSYCWYLENASISSAFKTQNHGYELFSSVLRGAPMAKSNKILLIWWLYNSESRISTIYTIMHSKRLPWIWLIHIRQRQNSSQIPLTVLIISASLDDVNGVLSQRMDPLCFNYELCRTA